MTNEKKVKLINKIDKEKQKLNSLVESEPDLQKKETYEQSCKLDDMVVEFMRDQLKNKKNDSQT